MEILHLLTMKTYQQLPIMTKIAIMIMIMMITIHQIQVKKMKQHLQRLAPPINMQHRFYG